MKPRGTRGSGHRCRTQPPHFCRLIFTIDVYSTSIVATHYEEPTSAGLLPPAASEVGKLHWRAALSHRCFAQGSRSAPGGRIVHIHIRHQTFSHALDEAVVHNEVHASVSAPLASQLSDLGPQRVLVLRLVFVERGPVLASFLPVEVKSSWV